ncbi:MAG: LamG domain-containing protein [Bacteroidetes bacterium]|nr:LamG domain-containing protein [Bacteroidota bacterium]
MKKSTILMWAIILPLSLGLFISGCKKDKKEECPTVNYTVLDATIQLAVDLNAAAVEGTALGQYLAGAKAALQTAKDLGKNVRDTECVTQAALDAANTNLGAAITAFDAQKITDVSPANLIAHWLFNGDANDATANGNNGTPTAGHTFWGGGTAPQLVADRFGNANYCYHFDKGSNIEVPYSTALNPPDMTISLWIKMEEQPNNDYIIAMNRWNGWKLNLQDANFLFFTIKTNQGIYDRDSNPGAILPDVWTYVTVTFTDGFMNFYIDGELALAWDNTPGIPAADGTINVSIGSDLPTSVYSPDDTSPFYVNWGGYFKGNIDDVRFYNVVLTATQITSLYNYEKDNVVE